MPKTRRVEFKFDERSLESMDKLGGDYQKMYICNPQTGEERVIYIPKNQPSRLHTCTGRCWCMDA